MSKPEPTAAKKVLGTVATVANYLSPLNLLNQNDEQTERSKPAKTEVLTHNGITWQDIENPNRAALKKLEDDYAIQPLHLYDSILDQPPTLEKEDQYVFILLYTPNYDAEQDKITTGQLGVFLGKKFVVTVHNDDTKSIKAMIKACQESNDLKEEYFKKSSAYLLHTIITNIISDLSVVTQSVVQELDRIEDQVFDADESDALAIGRLRQKIIRIKRITNSLKGVLETLKPVISSFTADNLSRQMAANTKTLNKLLETIDEAKETVEIYKDADFTASTEKTNQILTVLTLIFTFTIPPTVLGTFFGMNILLPGGIESGAWTFWGRYTTLFVLLLTSAMLLIAMYWYFKKKKWF